MSSWHGGSAWHNFYTLTFDGNQVQKMFETTWCSTSRESQIGLTLLLLPNHDGDLERPFNLRILWFPVHGEHSL
jgi:hypothetical protein